MHTRSRDQILCRAESSDILLKRDQISEQRPDFYTEIRYESKGKIKEGALSRYKSLESLRFYSVDYL
jgi:hypothetical protein